MWNDTRRGRALIRKRYTTRKFRLNVVNSIIIFTCVCIVATCGILLLKNTKNTKASIIEENNKETIVIYEEDEVKVEDKEFNIAVLGDVMMGGEIGDNLEYNYMQAFKNISEYTSKADYTICNLTTNVIDISKIDDAKSKYIVTKKIENALNALGVDGVNLASDHMLDFGKDIFLDTKNILQEDYDLIGLKDTVTYIEHNGIKVAVIGVTNEIIGNSSEYTDAGIMVYNLSKLKSMITEAKKNANTVILMTHLGLENSHTVTNIMSWFYKKLIDYGADIVLGTHALGVYPIEKYNSKYIIYSMGYFMHDTDYEIGKKGGIFNLKINKEGNLEEIRIVPTYINAKKQTILYKDYSQKLNTEFLNYLTRNIEDYDTQNDELIINLK